MSAEDLALPRSGRVLLTDLGIDAVEVARRAGLADQALDGGLELTVDQYFSLWNALEHELGPDAPVRFARTITADNFDPELFAALCCPHLEAAVAIVARWKRASGHTIHATHDPDDSFVIGLDTPGWASAPTGLVLTELLFWVALARLGTIAMALLTHDATVGLSDGSTRTVAEVLGDGSDPTRDHDLPDGAIITHVVVPAPWEGELGAYHRIISRFEAEWPLVEVAVRARLDDDGTVRDVALALGGVAPRPFAVARVTEVLLGRGLTDDGIDAAGEACVDGANPLPATGYKLPMIRGAVRHVLEELRSRGPEGSH